MCTSADEEPSSAAADVSGDASGSAAGSVTIPEVISTAPRIGLSQEAIDKIDWGDVATLSAIGALTGASSGALGPTLIGALGSAAGTIETQDDVGVRSESSLPQPPGQGARLDRRQALAGKRRGCARREVARAVGGGAAGEGVAEPADAAQSMATCEPCEVLRLPAGDVDKARREVTGELHEPLLQAGFQRVRRGETMFDTGRHGLQRRPALRFRRLQYPALDGPPREGSVPGDEGGEQSGGAQA